MKKVVIVNAGKRLSLSAEKGDYQSLVNYLEREIGRLESPGKTGEKLATVQVVNSLEDARQLIHQTDIMMFMTAGMMGEANNMKQENPRTKVVVWTGLLPDEDVLVLDKRWLTAELVGSLVVD